MPLLELAALMSEAKAEVLRLLLMHPERNFYQREIAERTGLHIRAVQQALEPLVETGIVTKERRGNQVFYCANPNSAVLPELTGLVVKTIGIAGPLGAALSSLSEEIDIALIFGSFASGRFRPQSDVDLLVIGAASPRDVVSALSRAAREIGREVNPVVMSPDELRVRVSEEDHFVTSVLSGPKVFVVGDLDELEKLVG